MAKGNMLQGMARGKVGDVVFYRMNGEQMSRVRNRHPQNPRTNAQLYQRMIMATILQAYSAGKAIFDHSFQGKKVGEENMRYFMSRNLRSLRGQLATEIKAHTPLADEVARVVAPASISPIPVVNLIASEGTLIQTMFTLKQGDAENNWKVLVNGTHTSTTKVSDYMAELGLRAGDICTIIAFINNDTEERFFLEGSVGGYATQLDCQFGWLRYTVKPFNDTDTIGDKTFGDFFNVECDGELFKTNIAKQKMTVTEMDGNTFFDNDAASGTIGFIKSRDDSKERSTCIMQELNPTAEYGVVAWYALEAWQKGDQGLGNSDLILEGGNEGVSADSNSVVTGGGGGSTDSGGSQLPGGGGW